MRSVEIDRVSPAGNPIAKEKIGNRPLIVYGTYRGDEVDVEVYEDDDGKLLGSIIDPTKEQIELAERQMEDRRERAKEIKKLERQREKRTSLKERTPDSVDKSNLKNPSEPKAHRKRNESKKESTDDNNWKDDNKNHLLKKDL
jgi:hypothetical protein